MKGTVAALFPEHWCVAQAIVFVTRTDSSLVKVGYQLRFLTLLCTVDLACTWYYYVNTVQSVMHSCGYSYSLQHC